MDRAELSGGYIFDIQGFSVHDGPGCRTLIFFKGCPLRCRWCSNPEGIRPFPEPLYNRSKCTFDLLCIEACPYGAITLKGSPGGPDATLEFEREKCAGCSSFECAAACCTSALNTGGYYISSGDLYSRIRRDRQYWGEKGGITLTGGEPFSQPEFAASVFMLCYRAYIHTAVETCGDIPWKNIEQSLPWLEWIFFDLKHMNDAEHRKYISSSNHLILNNAEKLSQVFPGRLIFRMPLIPGFNDGMENITATADFIAKTGRREINILPVHHLGREKFKLAGIPYLMTDQSLVSKIRLNDIKKVFEDKGIICYPGSDTPF
jgi:glycyl-radical enzyme activating protein